MRPDAFDEQIVQRFHDADDDRIVRGLGEGGMKRGVFADRRLARFHLPPLLFEDPVDRIELFIGCAGGRHARDGGLEGAPRVHQIALAGAVECEDRRHRRHDVVDRQLMKVGALAVPRLEQANHLETPDGVADRAAADVQPLGERAFRRQRFFLRETATDDHGAQAVGDLVGNAYALDGLEADEVLIGRFILDTAFRR
jgi:hypothetical protein